MDALRRGLGETASDNSTAFGFSLTIGGTGLILADLQGSPTVGEVFLLIGGAAAAMILINVLSTRGLRTGTTDPLPERAQMRGSALNFLSVGFGLLAAWGLGSAIDVSTAWLVCGFSAILIYLLTEALEYASMMRLDGE